MTDATLAELMITAASETWRGNGEVLASGITTIPRLGASLAKMTHSPELLMTDSEAYLVSEPVPLGARAAHYVPNSEGYLSFASVFALFLPALLSSWAVIDYPNESLTANLLVGGALILGAKLMIILRPARR